MTRIRVARIITRLNVGGPALQAILLTERLDPDLFESLLIAGSVGLTEGDMLSLRPGLLGRPIVISHLRRELSPLSDMRAAVEIARQLRRFRPHIVHTHLSKAGALGRIAARLCGVPTVVHTFHGNVFEGYFRAVGSRAVLEAERQLARLTTRLVAISPSQRRDLVRLGIAEERKVVEIPLGFDLDAFGDASRGVLKSELGLERGVRLVGIVARLVGIKRVDVFLDAAQRVAARRPDVHFVVVGGGDEASVLHAQATRLGLEARIHFLGWRSDLPAIYEDLDVLVLTSDNEGTPVSVIEALASRCAVVATDVGGVRDVLGDNERGVLVPAGDPGWVAEAVLALLGSPERRQALAAAGQEYVLRRHSARALIDRVSALYLDIAGR